MKIVYLALLLLGSPLYSAFTVKDGKMMKVEDVATLSVQDHYSLLLDAYQQEDWKEAIAQATILIKNFPSSPFFQEAYFYLGAGYFYQGNYDIANQHLSIYLKKQTALQHFREAIELKFQIAERFRGGYKKHIGGYEFLPQWMPAQEAAIKIYDEVINALPNDDLAAQALFGKAVILLGDEEYAASIETFQTLIRRFPTHPKSPDAYVEIARVYLIQSKERYPDADFLDLASINLKKFRQDFPTDDRVDIAEGILADMQEVYAESFYEIAQFFERTKKPHASILYYSKIVKAFPNTKTAQRSKERLLVLRPAQEKSHEETASPQYTPVAEPTSP